MKEAGRRERPARCRRGRETGESTNESDGGSSDQRQISLVRRPAWRKGEGSGRPVFDGARRVCGCVLTACCCVRFCIRMTRGEQKFIGIRRLRRLTGKT